MARSFIMVGKSGPLYECEFSGGKVEEPPRSSQFVLHAALDGVDEAVWAKPDTFLKAVDRFEDMAISAYVSAGGVRFMLLHPPMRSDDGLRNFFGAVHELYLKVVLNPFYEPHSPIASGPFDAKVRALAKKYLGR